MSTYAYATGKPMDAAMEDYGCGSVVRLWGSHGTFKLRYGHMERLRNYGTPMEGSRLRCDYGWVLLRLRLWRNYGGLLRRRCG